MGKNLTQLEVACGLNLSPAAHGVLLWSWSSATCDQMFDFRPQFTSSGSIHTSEHMGRPSMAAAAQWCCTATAAVRCTCGCGSARQLPQRSVLTPCRVSVSQGRGAMFDATSATFCDSRRVRMPTCALMHTAAHVPTAFCSPVLQASAEHRPISLARPTGSSRAHRS